GAAEPVRTEKKFAFGEATATLTDEWTDAARRDTASAARAGPAIGPPPVLSPVGSRRVDPDEPPPRGRRQGPPDSSGVQTVSDYAPTLLRDADVVEVPMRQGPATGPLVGAGLGLLLVLIGVGVAWAVGAFRSAGPATPASAASTDHIGEMAARTGAAVRVA